MRNIFLTALVIVCSCTSTDVPNDLIEPAKMVQVMTEVHVLDAKISNLAISPYDSTQAVYEHYEKLLFKDLGITQDQYERSFNYYVDHPNDFEKIYTAVVDTLMAREKRFK